MTISFVGRVANLDTSLCYKRQLILYRRGSFRVNLTNCCHPGSKISKLIFFVDSASNSAMRKCLI
jgi:hypothetical protein